MEICGFDSLNQLTDDQRAALTAKWNRRALTYAVEKYPGGLSPSQWDEVFEAAFQAWEDVADISIGRVVSGSKSDIVISTGRGRGDGFDGPSGVLAYAYLPQGDDGQLWMRIDLDEAWTQPMALSAITHEVGHLLGLTHSNVKTALMAPYLSATNKPQQNDDIPRIVGLYGPAKKLETPPGPSGKGQRIIIEFPAGLNVTARVESI